MNNTDGWQCVKLHFPKTNSGSITYNENAFSLFFFSSDIKTCQYHSKAIQTFEWSNKYL